MTTDVQQYYWQYTRGAFGGGSVTVTQMPVWLGFGETVYCGGNGASRAMRQSARAMMMFATEASFGD